MFDVLDKPGYYRELFEGSRDMGAPGRRPFALLDSGSPGLDEAWAEAEAALPYKRNEVSLTHIDWNGDEEKWVAVADSLVAGGTTGRRRRSLCGFLEASGEGTEGGDPCLSFGFGVRAGLPPPTEERT